MTDASLHDQYKRLQEQQKRKLDRLREINLRKSNSTGAIQIPQVVQEKENIKTTEPTFGVSDDLNLESVPNDFDNDDSLANSHTYRNDQKFNQESLFGRRKFNIGSMPSDEDAITEVDVIRQLKDENGRLYKLLGERDNDVKQLKSKLDLIRKTGMPSNIVMSNNFVDSKSSTGDSANMGGDAASVKIMNLSKKLREMTAELESERSKVARLNKRCRDLEHEQVQSSGVKLPSSPSVEQQKDEEIKQLKDKLKSSEAKLLEVRGQYQTTSHELKLAMKALSYEIGDKGGRISLHDIISGQSDWRGRHQKIMTLQNKVQDLERQLKEYQFGSAALDTPDAMVSEKLDFTGATSLGRSGSTVSSSTHISSLSSMIGSGINSRNMRQRDAVIKMQKSRQEALEKAETQLKGQTQEIEELKKKNEASRARNKVLTTEMKSLKEKMNVLLEKGHHDDELISTLLKQQSTLQTTIQGLMEKHAQTELDSTNQMAELNVRKEQESRVVQRLKEIIADKEKQIMQLQLNGNRADISPVDDKNKEQISRQTEPPVSVRSRAVSPFVLNSSEQHMNTTCGLHNMNSEQGSSNIAIEQEELRSLYKAAEVERDRLRELTVVQERRYEDLIAKQIKLEEENSQLRRRCANMERQIQKSSGKSNSTTTSIVASFTDLEESDFLLKEGLPVNQSSVENLQNALSLSRDEVTALKQGLKRAMEAKREDLKMLTDIISQTRDQFLQSINQIKKMKK